MIELSSFFPVAEGFKFVDDQQPGAFEGYGSVFGKQDSHGDVILPGAFAESLAMHKTKGTMPGMFAEHSPYVGGDPLPIGVWTDVAEDAGGLRVKGRLSALDTDAGRRIHGLVKDGALPGLSIAYRIPEGGSTKGKAAGEPARTIKAIELHSIDIVGRPSNGDSLIHSMKALMRQADAHGATAAVVNAIKLHRDTMQKGDAPTVAERAQMLSHLQEAHTALTGAPFLAGMTKAMPTTIREFEAWLREELAISNSQARDLAEHGFKTAQAPRDEEAERAATAAKNETLADLSAIVRGLSFLS